MINVQMNRIKQIVLKQIDTICVGLVMLGIFSYIMFVIGNNSDLLAHAIGAMDMCNEHRLFANNFLMYFMVNLLTCFSGNLFSIKCVVVFLIAMSNTVKYVLVKNEFSKKFSLKQAKMAAMALLVVFVVPVLFFLKVFGYFMHAGMYLGYYVPNVWHNSTILCMMPFAIIVFFLTICQFERFDQGRNRLITLFVVLGVLVKPSFFFVYMVACPICMFVKYRFRKEFFTSLLPIVAGIICVSYEFLSMYGPSNVNDDNGIAISAIQLFTIEFWKYRVLGFLISMALPAFFVLFYWKEIRRDMEFWFVLIMLVVALGICWCCMETGSRATHGNFGWQVVSSMWFVYYYMLKTWMRKNLTLNCSEKTIELGNIFLMDKVFASL